MKNKMKRFKGCLNTGPEELELHVHIPCSCPNCGGHTYSDGGQYALVCPMGVSPKVEGKLTRVKLDCELCQVNGEDRYSYFMADCVLENIGGELDDTTRVMALCPRCFSPMITGAGGDWVGRNNKHGVTFEDAGIFNLVPESLTSVPPDLDKLKKEGEQFSKLVSGGNKKP